MSKQIDNIPPTNLKGRGFNVATIGRSILNPAQKIREGVVFKAVDGSGSFKVINNLYLLKNDKKD